MAGHERIDNDGYADQRQRHKGEPDFRSSEILCCDYTDLRADDGAGVHDEGNEDVHVALNRMRKRSIAG